MLYYRFLSLLGILFFIAVFNLNFSTLHSETGYISIQDFKPKVDANIDVLNKELAILNVEAIKFQNNTQNLSNLKEQLLKTRNAYKKVEFILEYFYTEHVKEYINGPPFDHVDPNPIGETYNKDSHYTVSTQEYAENLPLDYRDKDHFRGETKVVHPVGLQVLGELIFSEDVIKKKQKIVALAQKLEVDFIAIDLAIKQRKYIADFEIMEAARLQLIRVFSMGITGFDTPGSLNAIEEARYSLTGLQEILEPLVYKSNSLNKRKVSQLFEAVKRYLTKNTDFDTFDRLIFLTDYINPLYKKLLDIQKELSIPSSSEKYNTLASWNANSDNVFSDDFLNPYYYSLLKANEDNITLRQLGKKIFYDVSISKSGTISCASCHNPALAFTDGLPKSLASIEGISVSRNAPSLLNVVFSDRFFYDLRAYDLEEQAEHVIENHLEFNTNYTEIMDKMNASSAYKKLFGKAFKNENIKITRSHFSSALSSYILSLRSFNSEFDQYVSGKTDKISNDVKRGFNLFMGKANCATCHFAPTFSGLVPPMYRENESEVLGVLKSPTILEIDADLGRFSNGIAMDKYRIYSNSFKTTTIRNTELTAPYFHNGAYKTLDEVIAFYNEGGASGKGLSYEVPNQTLPSDKLHLSKKEINDIKAFIISLTDNPFASSKE